MRFLPLLSLLTVALAPEAAAMDESGPQAALTVGVGALWFVHDDMLPSNDPTPAWSVRYAWDGGGMIGIDFAWTGNTGVERTAAQEMRVANFLESDMKLVLMPKARFTPFASAGIGWGHFLGAEENTDHAVFSLPMSLGAEVRGDRFIVAGRATWRRIYADETAFTSIGGDHLTTMVELGQRF